MWSMGLALNNSIDVFDSKLGLDLTDYRYGHKEANFILRDQLLSLNFEGVSGRIKYSNLTGYVNNRGINFFQIINNEMVLVESYNGLTIVPITTNGKTLDYIPDTFDDLTVATLPIYVGALFLTGAAIALLLLAASHVVSVIYRNHKSVKASSFKLLHVAYVGCYLMIFALVCYVTSESLTSEKQMATKCALYMVLNCTMLYGLTLIFSTVIAKTWRIYRIFVHYLDPGALISDKVLFAFIFACLLPETLALLAWGIVSPLHPEHRTNIDQRKERTVCTNSNYLLWFLPLLSYNGFLILLSCFLALLCHRIQNRFFKANNIIVLVYLLVIVLALDGTIYFSLPDSYNPVPEFVVLGIGMLAVVYSCLVLLFLVPLLPLFKEKIAPFQTEIRQRKTSTGIQLLTKSHKFSDSSCTM